MLCKKKHVVLYSMAAITLLVLLRASFKFTEVNTMHSARDVVSSVKFNQQNEVEQHLTAPVSPTNGIPIFGHNFPGSVYYFWCQLKHRYFEFRNYLSVMSVLQNLEPDSVIFFYDVYPVIDSEEYNTWLDEILLNTPSFQVRKAPAEACLTTGKVNINFLSQFLNEHRGVYVDENTIVTSSSFYGPRDLCNLRRDNVTEPRILCSSKVVVAESNQLQADECLLVSQLTNRTEIPFCLVIDRYIFPRNIWTSSDVLSRASRKIFYGNEDIPRPTPSFAELAPNIAHMVWMGGGQMDFLFYLAVLSLVHVAEVEKVLVHGDLPPTGYYWSLFENETRVEHVPHEPITMIFGKEIKSFQHMSDILRVEFMIKHGGIYLDTDAVFVKPLDKRIRAYDAVATYDWWDCVHPFPDFINFGVSVGKKGARFWHLFQETMRNFRDDAYILNGLKRPYKIMEKHPDLIFIEPHLQLQCFQLKCHPTWIKDFHNPRNHHLNPSVKIDWRTDVYAYHWTTPTPKEFSSFPELMRGTGLFADIGKFILSKSGKMDFFLHQQRSNTESY